MVKYILERCVNKMKIITNELINNFKIYLYEEERSGNTIEKYMRDVRFFREWLQGRNVDKSVVIEYKKELCQRYEMKSVNSMLSSVNAFFVFMGWYDLKIKTLKIQKQIFAKDEKELTKDEYKRLLNAAKSKGNQKLFLLMQTICATGIRVSELKYITLEVLKDGRADVNMKGKLRVIIIPQELCKMLKRYAAEQKITSGSIFVTKTGRPLDRTNIWKMMKALCESAGVARAKVFPHNLRHLFARTFYSIQKDIVRLADILGHSSVNTTRIYTMETGETHRRQIQKLGLLRL